MGISSRGRVCFFIVEYFDLNLSAAEIIIHNLISREIPPTTWPPAIDQEHFAHTQQRRIVFVSVAPFAIINDARAQRMTAQLSGVAVMSIAPRAQSTKHPFILINRLWYEHARTVQSNEHTLCVSLQYF